MMNCKDCLPLIPSYVDEELSEPQAAPLRQHLMDCRMCRRALSAEKSFKRWFEIEPELDVAVPAGFAERVARRAFAGDLGSEDSFESSREVAASSEPIPEQETPIFQFVLRSTAIAAGLLLVVSVLIFSTRVPDGTNVHGKSGLDSLEELDRRSDERQDPAISPGVEVDPNAKSALMDMAEAVDAKVDGEEGQDEKGDDQ